MKENRKAIINYLKDHNNLKNFVTKICEDVNLNTNTLSKIKRLRCENTCNDQNIKFFSTLDPAAQFMYLLDFQLTILNEELSRSAIEIDDSLVQQSTNENIH